VLCELDRGGMAVLFLARTSGPGGFERMFAIKMIHEHLGADPLFVHMFLEEARLAARIRHPNVVPVYEVGEESGRYFIAMEYVSGETLGQATRSTWPKGQPFPLDLATQIVALAAEGLHAAHELTDADGNKVGVIHRDVTPQNIMLGYDGTVRVMDFGVARALDQTSKTNPGTFKGTVAYMSPEQIRASSSADRRSDVFSLGVVLWETCSGRRLFKSMSDMRTAERVLRGEVRLASSFRPAISPELDAVILRALAPNPDDRYPTARALSEALFASLPVGRRVSSGDIEGLMHSVFADRMKQRREMERKAAQPTPPQDLSPPTIDEGPALPPVDEPVELDDADVMLLPVAPMPIRSEPPIDVLTRMIEVPKEELPAEDPSIALVVPVPQRHYDATSVVRAHRPSAPTPVIDPAVDDPAVDDPAVDEILPEARRGRAALIVGASIAATLLTGYWMWPSTPQPPPVVLVAVPSASPAEPSRPDPVPTPELTAELARAATVAPSEQEVIELEEGAPIEAAEAIELGDPVAPPQLRTPKPKPTKRTVRKWKPTPSAPGLFTGSDL